MASVTDQIDLFHEEICRTNLFEEIFNQDPNSWANTKVKKKYYSSDEYLTN